MRKIDGGNLYKDGEIMKEDAATGTHYFRGKVCVVVKKIFLKEEGKRGISLLTNVENSAIIFLSVGEPTARYVFNFR